MSQTPLTAARQQILHLEFPQSLGTYDAYPEAQQAVDFLADREFPVQDVMIVGTDLKQIERVTGRLTTGRVLLGGALSGVWIGVFVGLVFAVFEGGEQFLVRMLSTMIIGAFFGLVWGWLGYKATGGQRDFTSVSQVVAAKYEVLCEHRHVTRGRELLTQMDPMKAAQEQVRQAQEAERARMAAEAHPTQAQQPQQGPPQA